MTHNSINYLELLHENGYRITSQRQVILDAVCLSDGHSSIGKIFHRAKELDKGIDKSTVYRALDLFVKLGIVNLADDINGERGYEMVKEGYHHHLLCKICGNDLEIENFLVDEFYEKL